MSAAAAAISLPPRVARVSLYRDLLRTASRFHDYNFRMYAQRQVKEKVRGRGDKGDRNALAVQLCGHDLQLCPLAAAAAAAGRSSSAVERRETEERMRMRCDLRSTERIMITIAG